VRIFTRDGRASLLLMINDILVNRDGLLISIATACFSSLESVLLSMCSAFVCIHLIRDLFLLNCTLCLAKALALHMQSRISASPNSDRATGVCFWITEIQGSYNIEKNLLLISNKGVVKRLDKDEQQTGRS